MMEPIIDMLAQLTVVVLGIVGTAFLGWLRSHIRNKQACDVLSHALENALGAAQRAAGQGVRTYGLQVPLIVEKDLRPALAYVLAHAGPEIARLNMTSAHVLEKLQARLGLLNIETNRNTATAPLAPVASAVLPAAR